MVLKRIYLFQSVQIVWEWCKNVWYSNRWISHLLGWLFENDVKMYGTQTAIGWCSVEGAFENDVKMYGTQTVKTWNQSRPKVWEWCKNVWYSNDFLLPSDLQSVWEWCKNVWYSNNGYISRVYTSVWEWCKNVWYSNLDLSCVVLCRFENDVKMYGTQTLKSSG